MDRSALLLALANLTLIGALPRIFFRRGTFNVRWWATASPFFVAAGLIVAALAGGIEPTVVPGSALADAAAALAVLCCAVSIALIGFTVGAHRVPLALWHQDDDAPVELVTWGPYARVRHPFYAAFLVGLLGAAAALPHWAMPVLWLYTAVQLHRTACREEQRLLVSALGTAYGQYYRRTRRFVPLRRREAGIAPAPAPAHHSGAGP
jgi:protein-S-isoprenylcysteine O-methyltransferase Ste14